MTFPVHITYRDFPSSEALSARINEEVLKLGQFYDRITSCHVVVELPHKHKVHGRHFRIKVDVSLPGKVISVGRDPAEHREHEDPYLTVTEIFHIARRQLQDYVRVRRGDVKHHEAPPEGVVARLVEDEECGFIATDDGREMYFHKNSLLNGSWQKVNVGARVRFVEEQGEKGPQASTVVLVAP